VDQENATALEPNNQILAASIDGCDALAVELGRHLGRLEWTHEPGVRDLHVVEAPSDKRGFELAADALDFWQLGHGTSVDRPCVSAAPVLRCCHADAGRHRRRARWLHGRVVLTEVVFPNNQDWPIVVPFALAVVGWLSARAWVRRLRASHDDAPDKASTV
jgi:hypothetical protein